MAKFNVSISRVSTKTIEIEIEANSMEEAETKAMDEAYNTDYGNATEDNADYVLNEIEVI